MPDAIFLIMQSIAERTPLLIGALIVPSPPAKEPQAPPGITCALSVAPASNVGLMK